MSCRWNYKYELISNEMKRNALNEQLKINSDIYFIMEQYDFYVFQWNTQLVI